MRMGAGDAVWGWARSDGNNGSQRRQKMKMVSAALGSRRSQLAQSKHIVFFGVFATILDPSCCARSNLESPNSVRYPAADIASITTW